MKKKILNYLLLIIFIIGYNTYGQSKKSYLLSNNQESFVNKLISSNKSKSSTFKTKGNKSFSFDLNIKNEKENNLTLLGTVNGEKLSSFSISRIDNILNGHIILNNAKKAYLLYSETNGKVFIEETDINKIICVDFEKANTEVGTTTNKYSKMASPLILESLPGALGIIYLDFDGELVSGTSWLGGATIDAESPNFSDQKIIEVWKIMAEDFRPFNLNVTTRRDLFDAAPINRRMMCIFTPTNDAQPGSGGVAYVNSFSSNVDNPCWVYNLSTRAAGETGSHEVGHTLGLSHDGQGSTEYYAGHGQWSPIMGWSVNKPIGQWSAGEYDNATSNQNDIAIIANSRNGVGFQNDDHSNDTSNATSIKVTPEGVVNANQNFGLISTRDDKDVFTFAVETGTVSLNFNPDPDYPNLNIQARILNELEQEIAISNPNGLNASINQILTEGIYYIEIDGVGEGTVNNGYSDFSSLGNYTISGNYTPGDDKNPPLSEFEAVKNCFTINFVNNSTNKINSYLWDFGDGTTSTNKNPSHTYTSQGNYTVSLTTTNDTGDNTKEKVNFINIQTPNQPTVSDLNICRGESATLTVSGNSEYLWYTSITENTSIASGTTFVTPPLDNNITYYIEGVIGDCITKIRTQVKVTISDTPEQPLIKINQNKKLAVTSEFYNYQWYYNGKVIDGADQSEHLPTKVGEYSIEISNKTGCKSLSKKINIDQTLLNSIRQNKTFTYYPNPINNNNFLYIDGFTPEDYDVTIVNLQGKIVIQSAPISKIDISELSNGLYILLINNKPIGKLIRE
ncbi:PKD domain-containing protein [Aquimarina muelleri]|uniref:PKD domain-containing protein n=1 Tax=Aquimarina muelleri TaxID=279356 RepID=A0A918N4S5_9FLAO|nr:PKD domain-containing protein [Aquimarina muelleri]MCX2763812.1 PKD domain-containing protein [Aquimarina muelleri]GGX31261.1 hypothetical protein GCM10007384_35410 [Aquimarina muelleri]